MHDPQTSSLAQRVSRDLLPFVRQPAQYIGRERNQLVADGDWQNAALRLAIAFPDSYPVGISHLGCQIIYWIANHMPGVCAERVYCPCTDAERLMRSKKIELFTWDTRQPVRQADILAFSLQYEMTYTNVLTMLDLAGIALRADQRSPSDPIILAGGPLADNPEPVADFFDVLVLGDAEPSVPPLLEACRQLKAAGAARREIIAELAKRFEWLYAPALYHVSYNADGTIQAVEPNTPGIRPRVRRCCTTDLEHAPAPLQPLVPHVLAVHDRISIEIMRGCPHRCLFCHASHTKRPLTLRSPGKILQLATQAWQATGYEQIGLLSLSTGDYPYLAQVAEQISQSFTPRRVNISVPSLRIDKALHELPWMLNCVRKPGLTFAPETASDQFRHALGKRATNEDLFQALAAAYNAGWRTVKLYFLCGLPGETDQDIAEIYHLAARASQMRKDLRRSPAIVNVTVSWFVPKPHTPLQWAPQPTADYFHRVRGLLANLARRSRLPVRLKFHDVQRSVLEAALARGDRRLGSTIQAAWQLGARFDAWDDSFDPAIWTQACNQTAITPAWYAHRARSLDEVFPWSHLAAGPPTTYLRQRYRQLLTKLRPPDAASPDAAPAPGTP